jgi:hypothetical protein
MYSSKRLGKNRVVGYAGADEAQGYSSPAAAPQFTTPGFTPLQRQSDTPWNGGGRF